MKDKLKWSIGLILAILLASALILPSSGRSISAETESGEEQTSAKTEFPARYDPRELGLVTPVKNQQSYGTCWAFASASVMEGCALVRGYGEYDLSEYQLAYAMMHRLELEGDLAAGEGPECKNASWLNGPYCAVFSSTLLRGWALRTEEEFPYSDIEQELPADGLSFDGCLYPDSCYAILPTDTAAMKTFIKNNGGVYMNVCAASWTDPQYGNIETGAAYLPSFNSKYRYIDHFIAIVGWDDEYSRDNFVISPPGDGAWIIKNSWGTEYGDNGYFYLSYFDAVINDKNCAVSITVSPERYYDRIYQYDGGVGLRSVKNVTDVVINFSAAKNEAITGVRIKPVGMLDTYSFYSADWAFEPTDAKISVYKGVFGGESADDACPIYTQEYRIDYPDYQTVRFDREVQLDKDGDYYVTVTFDRPICYALDCPVQTLYYSYTNIAGGEPGETYIRTDTADGESKWDDAATKFGKIAPCSACVRVLVRDSELPAGDEANDEQPGGDNAEASAGQHIGIPGLCAIICGVLLVIIIVIVIVRRKMGRKAAADINKQQ